MVLIDLGGIKAFAGGEDEDWLLLDGEKVSLTMHEIRGGQRGGILRFGGGQTRFRHLC